MSKFLLRKVFLPYPILFSLYPYHYLLLYYLLRVFYVQLSLLKHKPQENKGLLHRMAQSDQRLHDPSIPPPSSFYHASFTIPTFIVKTMPIFVM